MRLKCRECRRDVNALSLVCPYCDVPNPVPPQAVAARRKERRRRREPLLIGLAATGIVGGFSETIGTGFRSVSTTAAPWEITSAGSLATTHALAETQCQVALLSRLPSPTTATFTASEFRELPSGTGRGFVVRGQARASDLDGVPITRRYVCVVFPGSRRVQAWLRRSNRAMYDEVVRLAGF